MLPDVWKKFLREQRNSRNELKLTRKLRSLRHLGSTKVQIGSHEFLNFSSNDYLGLTGDLRIAEAAASAAGRYGWGTGASRLVTGSSTLHTKLETEIAAFRDTESALLFGSGYQANLGVLSALAGPDDTIISDSLNHASIVAGCKLSGAVVKIFKHRDYTDLERILNGVRKGKVIVVTDSLFSIEGDVADVPRIVKLCDRFGALLVVDDAHASGCLGKRGRGIVEIQHVASQVPIVVATFSKALGSYGGFVACDEEVREFLVNNSRPFIYTTAIPIALAAANLEALKIVRKEGEQLRQRLATNTGFIRGKLESAGFELTGDYHVIGITVQSPEEALFISHEVEFNGILVHPMRWPTVPEGKDCLRISITAAHTEEDLGRLLEALKKARNATAKKKTDGLTRRQSKRPTHASLETSLAPPSDDFGGFGDFDNHPDDSVMSAQDSSRLPPPDEVNDFDSGTFPATAGDTLIVNPGDKASEAPTKPVPKADLESEEIQAQEGAEEAGEEVVEEAAEAGEDKNEPVKDEADSDGESTADDSAEASADAEAVAEVDSKVDTPASEDADKKESENKGEKQTGKIDPDAKADPDETPTKEVIKQSDESDDDKPLDDENGEADEDAGAELSGATLAPEQMELADPVIADIEGGTKKRKRKRK